MRKRIGLLKTVDLPKDCSPDTNEIFESKSSFWNEPQRAGLSEARSIDCGIGPERRFAGGWGGEVFIGVALLLLPRHVLPLLTDSPPPPTTG
ncbi:hypothetical protein J6590_062698 [Homalodisca vitripennis]|nr:hypothetical protein J6590_062698 [Homalodisca vitripennis]